MLFFPATGALSPEALAGQENDMRMRTAKRKKVNFLERSIFLAIAGKGMKARPGSNNDIVKNLSNQVYRRSLPGTRLPGTGLAGLRGPFIVIYLNSREQNAAVSHTRPSRQSLPTPSPIK